MECLTVVQWECPRKHRMARACSQVKADCHRCAAEDKARERREKRDADLDAKRDRLQKEYMAKLNEIKDQIDLERQKRKDQSDRDERERVLEQQRQELERQKERKEEDLDLNFSFTNFMQTSGF